MMKVKFGIAASTSTNISSMVSALNLSIVSLESPMIYFLCIYSNLIYGSLL